MVLASCTKSTSTTTSTTTTTQTKTTATTSTTTTTQTKTTATTPPTSTTSTATTTTVGNWWDFEGVPRYGGTLNLQVLQDVSSFDPYLVTVGDSMSLVYEALSMRNWTLDPKIWKQDITFKPPQYMSGLLAKSWEQPDTQTIIFHIQQGVHWQNIAPVNGRELTANDVAYSFQRMLGLGSGFTAPAAGTSTYSMIQSVTATDKYTVVFKSKYPTLAMLNVLLDSISYNLTVTPEAVAQWGNLSDWRHVIGTGPFTLVDYVSGGSLTFKKNPNYWGYDERYPANQLPYVDQVKILVIPQIPTALAALRTGKLDLLDSMSWTDAASVAKTNPEIKQVTLPYNGFCLIMREDKAPYTDIRVRQAMQMAMDLPTIATSYYGGIVDGTPYPLSGPALPGYYFPYAEWPQTLKDSYAYNPAGAKQLLAAAGYPTGFKTSILAAATGQKTDLDLLQIAKSYLSNIGVDMQIITMEAGAWQTYTRSGKVDQMVLINRCALTFDPLTNLSQRYSTQAANMSCVHDPVYDKMVDTVTATVDPVAQQKLIVGCDQYAVEQHWLVALPATVTYDLYQPWLMGYDGEYLLWGWGVYASRWSVNQDMKKAMGY